ncbi:MAG: hypothetical protein AAB914_00820, partial [Patescibacteria group bacterium]
MRNTFNPETLSGKVEAIFTGPEHVEEDRIMARLSWKEFVLGLSMVQAEVARTHYFSSGDRRYLEDLFAMARYGIDLEESPNEGPVNVSDLHVSGFVAVRIGDRDKTIVKEPQFKGARMVKEIRAVECDIHAIPLDPAHGSSEIREIGLEVV